MKSISRDFYLTKQTVTTVESFSNFAFLPFISAVLIYCKWASNCEKYLAKNIVD